MLMVLIFSILVSLLLLVIGSFLGKYSDLVRWFGKKNKSSVSGDRGYQGLSAHDILHVIKETKILPFGWDRGWRIRGHHDNCQTWRRRFPRDVISDGHVIGCCTNIALPAKDCLQHIRQLRCRRDWDRLMVSFACLEEAPPHPDAPPNTPTKPEGDIVRITSRWAWLEAVGLVDWLREFVVWAWLEKKWCSSSAVYQRYWYEEQSGCCWLLSTRVDRLCWTFYLIQPNTDNDESVVSVLYYHRRPVILAAAGSAADSRCLVSHLHSLRTYSTLTSLNARKPDSYTLPIIGSSSNRPSRPRDPVRNRNQAVNDSNRAVNDSNSTVTESAVLNGTITNDTITNSEVYEDKDKVRCDNTSTLTNPASPSSENSETTCDSNERTNGSRVHVVNSASATSSPTRKYSSTESRTPPRLTRAATFSDPLIRNQELNDWVQSTTDILHSENYSTQSIGLSCDSQYRTCSNHCASQIITELTHASNLDLSVKSEEQAKLSCGWVFSHLDKDVVVLKKLPKHNNSGICSYIGKGVVKASPRAVWDALRNPRTRFTYDDTMKRIEVLHDFGGGLLVVHMQHEVSLLFKKETRDFCILQGEKVDGDRYILTMSSIDWLPCPVLPAVTRGQFLASGWVVEPVFKDGRVHSMVTYLSQINLKSKGASGVDEIASKQPSAISQLRQLLVPRAEMCEAPPTALPRIPATPSPPQSRGGGDSDQAST